MRAKRLIKKIIPAPVRNLRHLFYAWWGAAKYGNPSKDLLVIGITGTTGKSTTTFFLRNILEHAGKTVGSLSTIDFYIAGQDKLNDQKMTMLGKMQIQKYLREMVEKKCDIAIVETTSEGIVQYRHRFIDYNIVVLTNLYPEHIESHGSFENYKNEKKKLFSYTASLGNNRSAVVNADSEYAQEFLYDNFKQKITFGSQNADFVVSEVATTKQGLSLSINGKPFTTSLFGKHNAQNVLTAVSIARSLGMEWTELQESVKKLSNPPGRIEFIQEAKTYGFDAIVDYAFEPVALQALYDTVALLDHKRIIHVCGATGGGRDVARREAIGKLIGKQSDIFIVTDEDPYDEDPLQIIKQVSAGAQKEGKQLGTDLFEMLSREEAIQKAISIAQKDDIILVTGKGSEQGICIANGKMISWDDRDVVRTALKSKS